MTHAYMKAFVAIIIYMGVVKLPSYRLYWSTHRYFSLDMAEIMPRDRFLNIMCFFHVCDNQGHPAADQPGYKPGYKVEKLAGMLIRNWRKMYSPGRDLAVDECLVPFKGRTKLKKYMPAKPHKWGVKLWCLCKSVTGYTYNWIIHTGKLPPDDTNRNITHRTVMLACEGVLDKGHHIYMDNYFSSPALYKELADHSTGACRTLRVNRIGVPTSVQNCKPTDDLAITSREGRLLFITWKDKRIVNLITSVHNNSSYTKKIRSRFSETHFRTVQQPKAIALYTLKMSGVDIADQHVAANTMSHRMLKWWKKVVLCNMLDMSIANVKVIHKALSNGPFNSTNFRMDIICGLLTGYEKPQRAFSRF